MMAEHSKTRLDKFADATLKAMASPRALFFVAAFFSLLLSVALFFTGDREQGIFVGIWVPSILSAGNLVLGGRRDV